MHERSLADDQREREKRKQDGRYQPIAGMSFGPTKRVLYGQLGLSIEKTNSRLRASWCPSLLVQSPAVLAFQMPTSAAVTMGRRGAAECTGGTSEFQMTDMPFLPQMILMFAVFALPASQVAGRLALVNNKQVQLIAQAVIGAVVLVASLFVILSEQYTPQDSHWAYGALGTVMGFWLRR